MQMGTYDKIQATVSFIQQQITTKPQVGIILGSGLGGLTGSMTIEKEIPFTDIPHFPASTVEGHAGTLVIGSLGGKNVVMMAGRLHYYEGYDTDSVTFPVRVMKALGAETLIVSNAAGGMNPAYKIGDIVAITDHINLFPEHPLRGPNDDRLGPRFPDMSEPYDLQLIKTVQAAGKEQSLDIKTGVYIGLTGPTFETPAEYKWLSIIGGDLVGMSTVPEVIVAIHAGMRVFAASVVTDLGIPGHVEKITHEEVLEAANAAAPKLAKLVTTLIERM
jgi:purine-nucleoside phosphorylase